MNRTKRTRRIIRHLSYFLLMLAVGCDVPRDPEGTYSRAAGGMLRVGIVHHPPWTQLNGESPSGIEVTLLRQFAESIDAEIEWTRDSESQLFEQLQGGRLDVVVGGIQDDTPWSKHVALTQPFFSMQDEKHVMAVRQGENRWLLELDRFLQSQRGEAMRLFQEHSTP
jgi:ABC-type amino acid transport substrate-binding protein